MPHSYASALFHCVFSTKDRQATITPDLRDRLFPYLGGIAHEKRIVPMAIGGVEDHVHLLLALPSTLDVAKAMQLIKGNSSKWVHETFPEHSAFAWQEGYGAFSIGISQVEDTVAYIANQQEHHRRKTFQEEFVSFLEKHKIVYDPRYLWD